jgi:hypothetical protein
LKLKSCTFPMRLLRLLTSLPCRMRVSTHPWNRNWDTKDVHLCSSMFHVHARQFADAFLAKITDLTGHIIHITPRAPNLSFSSFGCPGTGSGSPESDKCSRSRSGGSLGLIACFPQTLPAKKGDSMGWVNIKKVRKKNTDLFLLFEPNFFWVSNSYPYSFLSLIDFKSCLIGSLWVPSEVQIPSSWVRALEDRF